MTFIQSAHGTNRVEIGDALDSENHLYLQVQRLSDPTGSGPLAYLDSNGRAELRKHLEQFLTPQPAQPSQITRDAEQRVTELAQQVRDLQRQLRNSVSKELIGEALASAAEAADDSDVDAALEQVANELGVDFSAEVEFESVVTLQVTLRGTRPRRLPEEHEIRDLNFDVTVGNFHSETIESIEVMETGDPDVDTIETV